MSHIDCDVDFVAVVFAVVAPVDESLVNDGVVVNPFQIVLTVVDLEEGVVASAFAALIVHAHASVFDDFVVVTVVPIIVSVVPSRASSQWATGYNEGFH